MSMPMSDAVLAESAAPITYIPEFIYDQAAVFADLWATLPWERRADAPRRECWFNDFHRPYTYGRGAGMRTYEPRVKPERIEGIQMRLYSLLGSVFEGCFVNGYEGPRDHLGWHADDSPEIDDGRPIAVVSLGSARSIWFRKIGSDRHTVQLLEPGSLLVMHAGMQSTHEHRIPKHGADCGARISLTFRGLVDPK